MPVSQNLGGGRPAFFLERESIAFTSIFSSTELQRITHAMIALGMWRGVNYFSQFIFSFTVLSDSS